MISNKSLLKSLSALDEWSPETSRTREILQKQEEIEKSC